MTRSRSYLAAMGFLLVASGTAFAQQRPAQQQPAQQQPAQQQTVEGGYRGSMVCEHLPGTLGILRAPLDIIVSGTTVVAARPIFNRDGSRVVGSEIATGTVNSDGTLHLSSSWAAGGGSFNGTYSGTLNATGGTLTGTEAWVRSPEFGGNATRTCYGAYIRSPTARGQSREQ
jgi:hypothetical protein